MSSRLTSLRVSLLWSTDEESSFPATADFLRLVEELTLTIPKLNHLTFGNRIAHWTHDALHCAGTALAGLVQAQPTLQSLDIDRSLLAYLANGVHPMTHLVELSLEGTQNLTDPKPMNFLSLPSLRKVFVDVRSNIKDAWCCLLASAGSTIEDIEVVGSVDVRIVIELFTDIGHSCPSLRSLRMTVVRRGDLTLFRDLLLSLHPCAELTHLRIDIVLRHDISLSLHDEDVKSLALAWPKLEVLSLGPEDAWFSSAAAPTLSLYSFHYLCAHCPKLRSVRLTVKTVPIPNLPVRLSRSNFPPLESLHFGNSPIEDPYAIAKWLGDACLPDGIMGCAEHGAGDKGGVLWVQVRNTVALLQEARREVRDAI
jgi:hypothetical protein